jgi:hypothetical protein
VCVCVCVCVACVANLSVCLVSCSGSNQERSPRLPLRSPLLFTPHRTGPDMLARGWGCNCASTRLGQQARGLQAGGGRGSSMLLPLPLLLLLGVAYTHLLTHTHTLNTQHTAPPRIINQPTNHPASQPPADPPRRAPSSPPLTPMPM